MQSYQRKAESCSWTVPALQIQKILTKCIYCLCHVVLGRPEKIKRKKFFPRKLKKRTNKKTITFSFKSVKALFSVWPGKHFRGLTAPCSKVSLLRDWVKCYLGGSLLTTEHDSLTLNLWHTVMHVFFRNGTSLHALQPVKKSPSTTMKSPSHNQRKPASCTKAQPRPKKDKNFKRKERNTTSGRTKISSTLLFLNCKSKKWGLNFLPLQLHKKLICGSSVLKATPSSAMWVWAQYHRLVKNVGFEAESCFATY